MNISPDKTYLLQLGRHPVLSRSELPLFCDELAYWGNKNILQITNLKIKNPRNIPRNPNQLFLDRLGGSVAMAEVLLESDNPDAIYDSLAVALSEQKSETKIPLSLRFLGIANKDKKQFLKDLTPGIKKTKILRWLNQSGQNLEFGRIFNDKVLKKGLEFWIYKQKDTFGLAKLVAIQNLRNYTLRDHQKPFRDAKMGMLSPKLAQILINASQADEKTHRIVDPFCGSGTICFEAAIMGYETAGSDLEEARIEGAKQNNQFLSEKFRYDAPSIEFEIIDAAKKEYEGSDIVVTEGFLGCPFARFATESEIALEKEKIMAIWGRVFGQISRAGVKKAVICIPAWRQRTGGFSQFDEKILALAKNFGYISDRVFGGEVSTLYARPEAFVARQVLVLNQKTL